MLAEPLLPRDLTVPEPGSTTARTVRSRALRRALDDLCAAPRLASPGAGEAAGVLRGILRGTLTAAPGALVSVLRRPTVGGLLGCLAGAPGREEVFVALVAQLAFELAVAGALPAPVRLTRFPARLLSIPARLALGVAPGVRALVIENGRVTAERAGGAPAVVDLAAPVSSGALTVERPYHVISGEIVLALADDNPLAMTEAHPDKAGNAVDLGGHPASEWVAELGAALAVIERHLPEIRREMDLFVAQVVPVGWDAEKHLSASYQEVIGTLYLTLHPSRMTLAEALIHEFSHNKLNALLALDGLLDNAFTPLYRSPVRPDPRPLHGVLLAVHAFLPVARLYERLIAEGDPGAGHEDLRARFAAVRAINREGAELLLQEARPTATGQPLLDEIRRWHDHYARFDQDP